MKIFVDTAKLSEIKAAIELGVCDGVTTNPSLIKAAMEELKMGMEDYIKEICKTTGKGKPVSLEVISTSTEAMVKEAKILYEKFNPVAENAVIKIPVSTATAIEACSFDGIKAIGLLTSNGIKTNATLVMTPEQAFLAAKAGATYVSPFAGRIDDYLRTNMGKKFEKGDYYPAGGVSEGDKTITDNGIVSGVDLVKKIVDTYKNYNLKSEVIAASLRNPRQVREVALTGTHIATIPFSVIKDMTKHPKTVEGIIKFSQDVVEEYKKIFS
jgi:transaldolase